MTAGCCGRQPRDGFRRGRVRRVQLRGLAIRGDGAGRVALGFERRAEEALRLGGLRAQPDGALEPADRAVVLAARQRRASFGEIERAALIAILGRHQLAALGERGGGLVLAPGAGQRQPELIVRLAARRLQPHRFLQRLDRRRHLAALQQRLAERDVRARERRLELQNLAELDDRLLAGRGSGSRRRRPPD